MFIRLTNGVPETYTIGQLRRDNPDVSFPSQLSPDLLAAYGVYPLKRAAQPTYNSLTHTVQLGEIAQVAGAWVQGWKVAALPFSQQMDNLRAARLEAFRSEADPLFLKAQREEADLTAWKAKVQEIRDRMPYPEE